MPPQPNPSHALEPPKSAVQPRNRRNRSTRPGVLIADKAADLIIRAGGIFAIVAVFGIMVFLAHVVVPLFSGGRIEAEHDIVLHGEHDRILAVRTDESRALAVAVTDTGQVIAFHVPTGAPIAVPGFDLGGQQVTAFAATPTGSDLVFGFADGRVRFGALQFAAAVLPAEKLPTNLRVLDQTNRTDGQAIYTLIPGGQVRRVTVESVLSPPQPISKSGAAIVAIDYRLGGTVERPTRAFVTVDAAGEVQLSLAESRLNLLTRQLRTDVTFAVLPSVPDDARVSHILMTDKADQVYVGARDGRILRYDTRDFQNPVLAETARLLLGNAELNVLGFLIGEQSLVVGGSDGTVDVYFRLQQTHARTVDGYTMVRAHKLEPHRAAVRNFGASQRGKLLVTSDVSGEIWLRHSTSGQVLLRLPSSSAGGSHESVILAPRDDGILALDANNRGKFWAVAVPHPETTWQSIFGKVWYEGYAAPSFTWQSSSGTDSFEPKLSLVPLIFGTLKATLYSLLFAVPVALLAAIYTSEFLPRRARATVKPIMEMMASLPSVVLGFIAALVLAPIVENWIAAVLVAFFVGPVALVVGAYLWQILPSHVALRWDGVPKLALYFTTIILAAAVVAWSARGLEQIFFAGDFKAWANGDIGSSVPFMTLALSPVAYVILAMATRRWPGDQLRAAGGRRSSRAAALLAAAAALARLAAAIVVALAASVLITALGGDLRGGVMDTYVQRNALVVGFVMGFAVIPIIYTIAEDALNSVPEHLRAASLACGATTWQTAISVILPTAMSGVFAGVMVGMGRAVGETMIVVMAAGNTAILDWNLFNGLRALSANIAVELPEAVKGGTLFRMLFLAALALFVMTFIVNTLAEVVRAHFRKRAAQL
ncbi:MAG: ABC transporter permease subunit [Alphaproteobacteria bacterium]|nr:ABC transporter permease subunit [Alphaproteobacteria bacterium]